MAEIIVFFVTGQMLLFGLSMVHPWTRDNAQWTMRMGDLTGIQFILLCCAFLAIFWPVVLCFGAITWWGSIKNKQMEEEES